MVFMFSFHILMLIIDPPKRYPDLYWIANNAFSFSFFSLITLYSHCVMFDN